VQPSAFERAAVENGPSAVVFAEHSPGNWLQAGFDESLAESPSARWLGANATGAHVPLRGESVVALINAVSVGIGLAVAPCFLASAAPTFQVAPQALTVREIWLVARLARVRAVIDFIAEIVGADRTLGVGTDACVLPQGRPVGQSMPTEEQSHADLSPLPRE
jgi:DNA-binding transcriptional LysR family regulator